MKALDLNFSKYDLRQRQRSKFIVLMLILLVLAFVISEVFSQRQQLTDMALQQSSISTSKASVRLSEQDVRQNRLVQSVVNDLNTPWFDMLAALEEVKRANPEVYLSAFEPNVKKGEVTISGEVQKLSQLLAFVDALNQQPVFYQALLVNQRQLESSDYKLGFSLKVGWHSHE